MDKGALRPIPYDFPRGGQEWFSEAHADATCRRRRRRRRCACARGLRGWRLAVGPSGGSPSAGAVTPGGGLSVAEAIATDADPPLAVSGWIVGTGDDARLCSSYEPEADEPCGEPSLGLEGDVEHAAGKRVSLLGAVEGNAFVVSSTVR